MQENRTQQFEFGKGYVLKGYRKKSRFFGFCFFILSIALVISFSLFSANLIVGVSSVSSGSVVGKEKIYYLLSLNSFSDEKSALDYASSIKEKEGAGYVFYNKSYEVVAFAYLNEQDCVNVKNRLISEYKNAHVIPLTCKKFTASVQGEYKQSIIEAIQVFEESYSILYSLASSYVNNKEYYTSMNLINDLIISIENKKAALKEINSSFAVKVKSKLSEFIVDLKKVVDINESVDTFSSRIKYACCCAVLYRYYLGQ